MLGGEIPGMLTVVDAPLARARAWRRGASSELHPKITTRRSGMRFARSRTMNRQIIVLAFVTGLSGPILLEQALADQQKKQEQAPPKQSSPAAGKGKLGASAAEIERIAAGWRVTRLIGSEVVNDAGDKIGKFDDIIINGNGPLSVAVLDIGGFLGMGAHRVAIPVRQFTVSKGAEGGSPKIVLPTATKEALKSLPEFRYSK